MPLDRNIQVPSSVNSTPSFTAKKTVVIILVVGILIAAWFIFRPQTKTVDPAEVLAELTLGDTSKVTQPVPPDPSLDASSVYLVATSPEVAANLGISKVMSKQEIIDYYTDWFNQNDWNIKGSAQISPSTYTLVGGKTGQGLIQINILDYRAAGDVAETQGAIQVFIHYGFGR